MRFIFSARTLMVLCLSALTANLFLLVLIQRNQAKGSPAIAAEAISLICQHHLDKPDPDVLSRKAIKGAIEALDDPHSRLFEPVQAEKFTARLEGRMPKGIGISHHLTTRGFEITHTLPGSPAEKAGLQSGTLILAINGTEITTNNPNASYIKELINQATEDTITMSVQGPEDKAPRDISLQRTANLQIPCLNTLDLGYDLSKSIVDQTAGIAYLHMESFTENSAKEFSDAMQQLLDLNAKGLILDLRGNGGGFLDQAVQICSLWLPDQSLVVTLHDRENKQVESHATSGTPIFPANWPLVILVDRHSASASEILSGALQEHQRALVIGERTRGKATVQNIFDLGEELGRMKLTMAKYHLPSGRCLHFTGTDPWGVDPSSYSLIQTNPKHDEARYRLMVTPWAEHPMRKLHNNLTAESALEQLHDPVLSGGLVATKYFLEHNSWPKIGEDPAPMDPLSRQP